MIGSWAIAEKRCPARSILIPSDAVGDAVNKMPNL
jgi:hypothetical protein